MRVLIRKRVCGNGAIGEPNQSNLLPSDAFDVSVSELLDYLVDGVNVNLDLALAESVWE